MEMAISSATLNLSPISRNPRSFSYPQSSFFRSTSLLTRKTRALILGRTRTRTRTNPGLSCICLFGLGVPELVVIAGVAALLFGPKQLPEVGRSIGKTVKSFQQAAKEFESELKREPDTSTETAEGNVIEISEEVRNDVEVSSTKER